MEVGAVKLYLVSSSGIRGPASLVPAVPTTASNAVVSVPSQVCSMILNIVSGYPLPSFVLCSFYNFYVFPNIPFL